jgi:Asp/Glu/hydantoin racemase
MMVKGEKKYYGEVLGIARLDQKYRHPNVPGDVENASTYPFPVRMKIIDGLYDNPHPPICDAEGNYTTDVRKTVKAVKELAADGVRAIVMACGYFSLLQAVLAEEVAIPVFSSPLLLVPLVSRMIGARRKVGIIAASRRSLTQEFLEPAGITDSLPHVITGLEGSTEFYACFMGGTRTTLDVDRLRGQVVAIANDFVRENPDIGALVLECSALPPFAAAIQHEVGLPVFDYIGFVDCVYRSVAQRDHTGLI